MIDNWETHFSEILCQEYQAIRVLQYTKKLHYIWVAQPLPQAKFFQESIPVVLVNQLKSMWMNSGK